ncbi:serine/threonine protein kinase [bacterium]|nr:serine/threonine protein kinase [bacterium]
MSTAREDAKKLIDLGLVGREEVTAALDFVGEGTGKDLIGLLERRQLLTPFQIQKLDAGETTGFFAGPYKLLYLIAAGTFARVFRSIDPTTNSVVAVKILKGKHAADPETVKLFHREGEITENLVHPNITRTLEVGTDGVTGQHYIAMEFVEGGNLREFIKIRKKITAEELIRLAKQMVDGLRYAHSKGITHRDIKPTNILISAAGDIKWVDFGLGGAADDPKKSTAREQRTIDYAGLEKQTGVPKGDFRSDIFFLGIVFYELLTGDHPLGDRDRDSRQVQRFDSITPLSRVDGVPYDLAVVIDRMTAYRPEARYQDYDSILNDLEKIKLITPISPQLLQAGQSLPRVVVIHHSPKVQEILKGKLTRRGFQSMVTADIGRAAALCKFKPADCIIIDLDTTGREGVEHYATMFRTGAARSAVFLVTAGQEKWLAGLDTEYLLTLGKPLVLGPVYKAVRALVEKLGIQTHAMDD